MNQFPSDYYTYNLGRKCLNCPKLIPDQAHAATKFCTRFELPDGTVQSCKDDYHSKNRKIKDQPYKSIAAYHKALHQRLQNLWKVANGENISLDQLAKFAVNLRRPVEFNVNTNQVATYYFVEFAFTPLSNNQFKFFKHGRNF